MTTTAGQASGKKREKGGETEQKRKNESKSCAKIAAGVVGGLARYKIMKQKLDLKAEEMGAPISEASSDVVYSVSLWLPLLHLMSLKIAIKLRLLSLHL